MYIHHKIKHKINVILCIIIFLAGAAGIAYSVYFYPLIFEIGVSIENENDIAPKEAIKIKFSQPMFTSQTVRSIEMTPQVDVSYNWYDKNQTLLITPAGGWKPEQTYHISIKDARSIMFTETDADFSFETIRYPKVTEFHPAPDAQDVVLDIEDPIAAVFDRSIRNFKAKFSISPREDLTYQLVEEDQQVELIAEEELKKGEDYNIEVYVKHRDEPDENYRKIYSTSFTTKPPAPKVIAPDFTARIEEAKRFTEAKIEEGKYIDINTKSQILTIFEDGELLDAYLISSGKAGMGTPQGTFHIANKTPRAWSGKYGLYMPYWMALVSSGDYGIHELPEWPGGYKEGQSHLGTPVSHGCVRLGVGAAERVYSWTEIGTAVVIHE